MSEEDRPGYSFTPGPPPEVAAYFNNRGLRPSFSWQDFEPEEHAVAFTVAKAMQLDVLEAIHGSLQEAIDEGIPFEQWQRDLTPRLQALGWWGRQEMVDPLTGVLREVQLGSPRRLRTIYRANLRTARAAGQWDRIQRTARALPYLVYLLGPSERHRPQHEAKEGLVLPVDDPFWQQWFPPNGWGCKCHVRQITRREAEARGISESPAIPTREVFNQRTGELRQVPSGIDPGWESNPGLTRQRHVEQLLAGRLDAADPAIRQVAVRDIATSWRARRVLEGRAGGSVPIAVLPDEIVERIGAGTSIVQMTDTYGDKFAARARNVTTAEFLTLNDALQAGRLAVEPTRAGRNLVVHSDGPRPWRFVIKIMDGELWISSAYRTEHRRWRGLLRRPGVEVVRE